MTDAAIPEKPPEKNNYPCVADVVAANLLEAGYPPQIAADVMARKEMGLKKYGMALQPCNGRNNLNDLYQEIIDALKYAQTEYLERCIQQKFPQVDEILEVYNALFILVEKVYNLKNGAKPDGAPTEASDQAES